MCERLNHNYEYEHILNSFVSISTPMYGENVDDSKTYAYICAVLLSTHIVHTYLNSPTLVVSTQLFFFTFFFVRVNNVKCYCIFQLWFNVIPISQSWHFLLVFIHGFASNRYFGVLCCTVHTKCCSWWRHANRQKKTENRMNWREVLRRGRMMHKTISN